MRIVIRYDGKVAKVTLGLRLSQDFSVVARLLGVAREMARREDESSGEEDDDDEEDQEEGDGAVRVR